ncbi:hypothetical protein [Nonomuraea sp. NPDC049400]|uniref:hypothetical protein n=1 Tax=Nonomuraea sp. NPDC049400 TaxID=3364352 RepID=UPI0037AF46D3
MLPPNRLGFAIRKTLFDLTGVAIDESVTSAEVCQQFEINMAAFDADLAMCDRSALIDVLTFAEGASPDATTQAAIDQVQADIVVPTSP